MQSYKILVDYLVRACSALKEAILSLRVGLKFCVYTEIYAYVDSQRLPNKFYDWTKEAANSQV
jgi:hypothetical protein